jgi:dihydroneopterin aldolase
MSLNFSQNMIHNMKFVVKISAELQEGWESAFLEQWLNYKGVIIRIFELVDELRKMYLTEMSINDILKKFFPNWTVFGDCIASLQYLYFVIF